MAQARQCGHTKTDGSRCRAGALAGADRCFFHSPGAAGARKEAQRRGGRTRSRPAAVLGPDAPDVPLAGVADVLGLVAQTISQLRRGEVDARVANAIGYLASIGLRALEGCELARQVEELRRQVEDIGHGYRVDAAAGGKANRGPGGPAEGPRFFGGAEAGAAPDAS
jgi:hypothetical protein